MALTGTHKTNITTIEVALTAAINSLPSTSTDTAQSAVRMLLYQWQRDLQHIKDLRTQ